MTLKAFIRENREEIDKAIRTACPNLDRLDDAERRLWILNDHSLYTWARSENVKI